MSRVMMFSDRTSRDSLGGQEWLAANGSRYRRDGFFAVAAEFITINRANKKHMLNASRAARHEPIWDFSTPGKIVGWLALGAALVGTILWVFGDLMLPNA